ncbi:hypothetical protein LTR56_024526 [Elasticomyces elasticus]|nr:hypothetical protein LTR56_024526 [Elasticomyces elasticus]KAK3622696.1 hypothetical protein LTR22_024687 [Elasticomyces elasticus]KAK4905450.1 hypothetical protein LTR49_025270 [Elasticomyces elasticus]KAK5742590.1 hypothetical protein LTS12_024179 [Elasticomyces elasticus]
MPDKAFYNDLRREPLWLIHWDRGFSDAPKTHDELVEKFVLYDGTRLIPPTSGSNAGPAPKVILDWTFYDELHTTTLHFMHRNRGLHNPPSEHDRVVDQLILYDETHFPRLTGGPSPASAQGQCLIFALPPELRIRIYETVISDDPDELAPKVDQDGVVDMIPLLFVSKQVWHEAIGIWYHACDFQLQFLGPGKNDAGIESCTKWLHRVGNRNIKHVRRVTILPRIFANRGYSQSCQYEFGINLGAKSDEDLVESRGSIRDQAVFEAGLQGLEDQLSELTRKVRAWESKFAKRLNTKGWEVVFCEIVKLQKESMHSTRVSSEPVLTVAREKRHCASPV